MMRRRHFLKATAGAAATLPAILSGAVAQTYPARPITMIVPFPPGGNADPVGRLIAERLAAVSMIPVPASAFRLHPATSDTPVSFTYPPVRFFHPDHGVRVARYMRVTKRHRVVRRTSVIRARRHVTRISRSSCRPPEIPYANPPTGWRPLPYEFGPWCDSIVSRY